MSLAVQCPGCGAELALRDGAMVMVCGYCLTVVGRGDRDLEDLGKVVDLADSESVFAIGVVGSYQGVGFEVLGRARLGHPAGGRWDEWYAQFRDGRWGWIAEAQGVVQLMFQAPRAEVPRFEDIRVGEGVPGVPGSSPMIAVEATTAIYGSAEGQIPYRFVAGVEFRFVDLSGSHGEVGTIDYSEHEAVLYLGHTVTLADLGLADRSPAARSAEVVPSVAVDCPACGGKLELIVPDQTLRVACKYCGALSDCRSGALKKLRLLEKPIAPSIPIGATGTLQGVQWRVIGWMDRFVVEEGTEYHWEEYLLFDRRVGFRWLVCANDSWSFVEPVPAGEVGTQRQPLESEQTFRGVTYKLFQRGVATVAKVLGEFYWRVRPGKSATTWDFIAPPHMLSFENDGEVHWSLGTYLTEREVERAFEVTLPRAWQVAPHQPYPHKSLLWPWLASIAALVLLFIVGPSRSGETVVSHRFDLNEVAVDPDGTRVLLLDTVPLDASKNLKIKIASDVSNNWASVDGALIHEDTGWVRPFAIAVEYYAGVELGEAWSEGSRADDIYLPAPEHGGLHTLRLAVTTGTPELSAEARVQRALGVIGFAPTSIETPNPTVLVLTVSQGAMRLSTFLLVWVLISLPMLLLAWHRHSFETRRWSNSAFGDEE